MLKTIIFQTILFILIFCFGFLIGGVCLVFPFIEKAFFEAKITDYFSLIFTLLVGGGAAYFVGHSIQKSNHDATIIDSLVDKIEKELASLESFTSTLIEKKAVAAPVQKEDLTKITLSFKTISSLLTVVEKTIKKKEQRTRELFDSLKVAITDENFTLEQAPYTELQKTMIQDLFLQFTIQLCNVKVSSYI